MYVEVYQICIKGSKGLDLPTGYKRIPVCGLPLDFSGFSARPDFALARKICTQLNVPPPAGSR